MRDEPPSRIDRIDSAQNPLLKSVRKALREGRPTESGLCAIEGPNLLSEAIRSGCPVEVVIARDGSDCLWGRRNVIVPSKVLEQISSVESSQGVVSLLRLKQWTIDDLLPPRALVLVLDGIQDPGNAGTLIRAAEAFGATGVVIGNGTVSPWNGKFLRASAGSLFRVPFVTDPGAMGRVRAKCTVWGAVPRGGVEIAAADLRTACALVVGSEGQGLRIETGAQLRIPTRGVESLNAGVAGAIMLYEAARQRGLA
jgi:TrmH family RNA methyltransferase